MPEAVTRGVKVDVESQYVKDQSNPERNYYFFSYHVKITNEGEETVQLISRHWIITDEENHVEEVKGPGVVGEQPVLEPGESFEYTSFCPLKTPMGMMHGTYQMVTNTGEPFDAQIPRFSLVMEKITYH
jgi:ApaG protein